MDGTWYCGTLAVIGTGAHGIILIAIATHTNMEEIGRVMSRFSKETAIGTVYYSGRSLQMLYLPV